MEERNGAVTFLGDPLTLVGNEVTIGEPAPVFSVLDGELKPVSLADFRGKVCVILSVPSLDTPVCDMEIRRFNREASSLGDDVVILVVSMDLPFAQQRWCGAAGADQVKTASDHKEADFGVKYGILISELRLLARAAFVVDRKGLLRYKQIVKEISDEPDYQSILSAVQRVD